MNGRLRIVMDQNKIKPEDNRTNTWTDMCGIIHILNYDKRKLMKEQYHDRARKASDQRTR
jgi:hypothetical protein